MSEVSSDGLLPEYLNDLGVDGMLFGDQGYLLNAADLDLGMETGYPNQDITALGDGTIDPRLLEDQSFSVDAVDPDLDMETGCPNEDTTAFGEEAHDQPTYSQSNLRVSPDPCTSTSISTMPMLNQMPVATSDPQGLPAGVSSVRTHVHSQNPIATPNRQRTSANVPMHTKAGVKKHTPASSRQRVSATVPIHMSAGFQHLSTDSTPQPSPLPVQNTTQMHQMPTSSRQSLHPRIQPMAIKMFFPQQLQDFLISLRPQQQAELQDCLLTLWSYYTSHPRACTLHQNPSCSREPAQINTYESIPSHQWQQGASWPPQQFDTPLQPLAKSESTKPLNSEPNDKVSRFQFADPVVPKNFVPNPDNHGRWTYDQNGNRIYMNAPKLKTTSGIQNAY